MGHKVCSWISETIQLHDVVLFHRSNTGATHSNSIALVISTLTVHSLSTALFDPSHDSSCHASRMSQIKFPLYQTCAGVMPSSSSANHTKPLLLLAVVLTMFCTLGSCCWAPSSRRFGLVKCAKSEDGYTNYTIQLKMLFIVIAVLMSSSMIFLLLDWIHRSREEYVHIGSKMSNPATTSS